IRGDADPADQLGAFISGRERANEQPLWAFAAALYMLNDAMLVSRLAAPLRQSLVGLTLMAGREGKGYEAFVGKSKPVILQKEVPLGDARAAGTALLSSGCLEVRVDRAKTAYMIKTARAEVSGGRCGP